jgi:Helix-turn-helix domain
MGARRIDSRLIKVHRSYSIFEAAQTLGVHQNTVANWLRNGLKAIDKVRPILIHGTELRRFLKERRHNRRSPCKPDEMWCLRCRTPRRPEGGLVDYNPRTSSHGNLSGLCPACGCLMNRQVSATKLNALSDFFDIAFPQVQSRINDCPSPSLNCAFGEMPDDLANLQR